MQMTIGEILGFTTRSNEKGYSSGAFPENDFEVFKGQYNFNAPYLRSILMALCKNKGVMCLTPATGEIPQQGKPEHNDRNIYLDTRSESTIPITNKVNVKKLNLVLLCQLLEENLRKKIPNQEQFIITGLGENLFEYYTVSDINKDNTLGDDISTDVISIFNSKN